jgi:hypothetical protein
LVGNGLRLLPRHGSFLEESHNVYLTYTCPADQVLLQEQNGLSERATAKTDTPAGTDGVYQTGGRWFKLSEEAAMNS